MPETIRPKNTDIEILDEIQKILNGAIETKKTAEVYHEKFKNKLLTNSPADNKGIIKTIINFFKKNITDNTKKILLDNLSTEIKILQIKIDFCQSYINSLQEETKKHQSNNSQTLSTEVINRNKQYSNFLYLEIERSLIKINDLIESCLIKNGYVPLEFHYLS